MQWIELGGNKEYAKTGKQEEKCAQKLILRKSISLKYYNMLYQNQFVLDKFLSLLYNSL